jgi:hypothetical protein
MGQQISYQKLVVDTKRQTKYNAFFSHSVGEDRLCFQPAQLFLGRKLVSTSTPQLSVVCCYNQTIDVVVLDATRASYIGRVSQSGLSQSGRSTSLRVWIMDKIKGEHCVEVIDIVYHGALRHPLSVGTLHYSNYITMCVHVDKLPMSLRKIVFNGVIC